MDLPVYTIRYTYRLRPMLPQVPHVCFVSPDGRPYCPITCEGHQSLFWFRKFVSGNLSCESGRLYLFFWFRCMMRRPEKVILDDLVTRWLLMIVGTLKPGITSFPNMIKRCQTTGRTVWQHPRGSTQWLSQRLLPAGFVTFTSRRMCSWSGGAAET